MKTTVQVNIQTCVNSASIRREMHNGREHIVMPSYTLPGGVIMNNGLYPAEEIDKHYRGLDGTLAPLGHPTVNGEFVSAFSPEGINVGHIGAWNRNVKKVGNRVYLEKWLDVEVAQRTEGGQRLLERVEALARGDDVPAVHTSVAVFLERLPAPESAAGSYDWVAKISGIDHDAILLDEVGAATPEQGVGLMVNADAAQPMPAVDNDVLGGKSYGALMQALSDAAVNTFATGADDFIYVADFTDTHAIVVVGGGQPARYAYTMDGGEVRFASDGVPVKRRESWVLKLNRLLFGNRGQPSPGKTERESKMDEKERADFRAAIVQDVQGIIAPMAEQMAALQANQTALAEKLTANEREAEASQRLAVEVKFGKAVADGLGGAALDALYKQCGAAATLAGNSGEQAEPSGTPDPAQYFGGV